jgi:hypothetical protein
LQQSKDSKNPKLIKSKKVANSNKNDFSGNTNIGYVIFFILLLVIIPVIGVITNGFGFFTKTQSDIGSPESPIRHQDDAEGTSGQSDSPLDGNDSLDQPFDSESENDDNSNDTQPDKSKQTKEVIMFHNGTGPMCVQAEEFFAEHDIKYQQYLTKQENFKERLAEYQGEFDGASEGVSENFGYYPMIFVGDRAFSGFDEQIGKEILETALD